MLSRKYEARDLEKGCWTKRWHGVALREPTRLFSGLVLEAYPFIADVAWLNPRIFSSFDTLRVYRARLARQNRFWPVFRHVRSVEYGNALRMCRYCCTVIFVYGCKDFSQL